MKAKLKNQESLMLKLREIRESLSKDIQDMSFEELKAYLENQEATHPTIAKDRKAGKK